MHLSDSFLEIFTFIRYVADPSGVVEADYATVREDVSRLIQRLEQKVREKHIPQDQFDMARFAVFAWADEAILCSSWSGTGEWLKNPLQREYYETANAGEEFFQRLDMVLRGRPENKEDFLLAEWTEDVQEENEDVGGNDDVLEVFTLCLSLGFTGMFFNEGDQDKLKRLRQDCISRIVDKEGVKGPVFPAAYGTGAPATQKSRYGRVFDPLSILFFILPLLVLAGVFFAYRGLLEHSLNLWFG